MMAGMAFFVMFPFVYKSALIDDCAALFDFGSSTDATIIMQWSMLSFDWCCDSDQSYHAGIDCVNDTVSTISLVGFGINGTLPSSF